MQEDPAPSNPHEAWHQRALQVRLQLATLTDDELLALVRRREIDITGGLWDAIQQRQLGPVIVQEIMNLLVEVEPAPTDSFLYYYHAADALLKFVSYPCVVGGEGNFNTTARNLASDFHGERHRHQQLRDFWPHLLKHCADRGLNLDWEPDWKGQFPRYHSTDELKLTVATLSAKPPNPQALRNAWRAIHRKRLAVYQPPTAGESITFSFVDKAGTHLERVHCRYLRANLEVLCDFLERPAAATEWSLPSVVTLHFFSDAASINTSSISASHHGPLYDLGYR